MDWAEVAERMRRHALHAVPDSTAGGYAWGLRAQQFERYASRLRPDSGLSAVQRAEQAGSLKRYAVACGLNVNDFRDSRIDDDEVGNVSEYIETAKRLRRYAENEARNARGRDKALWSARAVAFMNFETRLRLASAPIARARTLEAAHDDMLRYVRGVGLDISDFVDTPGGDPGDDPEDEGPTMEYRLHFGPGHRTITDAEFVMLASFRAALAPGVKLQRRIKPVESKWEDA
jgi:hypothetical protein